MKITIDTKEDSHEEIRKVIRMLSSLVGEEMRTNQGNIFEDNAPSETSKSGDLLGSLFGGGASLESSPSSPEESKPKIEEKKDETPSIEFYN